MHSRPERADQSHVGADAFVRPEERSDEFELFIELFARNPGRMRPGLHEPWFPVSRVRIGRTKASAATPPLLSSP